MDKEIKLFKKFQKNSLGRDFCVGDIHGNFSALELLLAKVNFDKTKDRLFSVGDLIDRGKESTRVLEFLAYPWFFPVAGNHEYIIIGIGLKTYKESYPEGKTNRDGNQWFFELDNDTRMAIVDRFKQLPIAIQIGKIGIVHAYPLKNWRATVRSLKKANSKAIDSITRSRTEARKTRNNKSIKSIKGIDHVIVGHSIFPESKYNGNCRFLDTGYYSGGKLSLIDLSTMELVAEQQSDQPKK